jgi:hypothetical protein
MIPGKHIAAFFFLYLSTIICHAQDDAAASLQLVKEIFRKSNGTELPVGEEVYFFDYQVKTIMNNKDIRPSLTQVKMYVDKDKSILRSAQMEVYQDKQYSFMVLPTKKAIYWGDSQLGTVNKNQNQEMSVLQEKIFEMCKVKSSAVSSAEGKYNKEIFLEPSDEFRKKIPVASVKFLINTKTKSIYKTIINYLPGNNIASIEITYTTVDYNYKSPVFIGSVKSKFFNSNGALLSSYKGYEVTDIRKNSK